MGKDAGTNLKGFATTVNSVSNQYPLSPHGYRPPWPPPPAPWPNSLELFKIQSILSLTLSIDQHQHCQLSSFDHPNIPAAHQLRKPHPSSSYSTPEQDPNSPQPNKIKNIQPLFSPLKPVSIHLSIVTLHPTHPAKILLRPNACQQTPQTALTTNSPLWSNKCLHHHAQVKSQI